MMSTNQGNVLLRLARCAIGVTFGEPVAPRESGAWLDEPGATFVTLTRGGELRGCIGSLMAERPLRQDVADNARAAAFRDPRFPSLTRQEFSSIAVEVSLLSELEPMAFESESDLLTQLRPGIDGVLLEHGWQRGTFLPQVWEQLPEPKAFLAHLRRKAGLSPDFWAPDLKVSRYTVSKWCESEPRRVN